MKKLNLGCGYDIKEDFVNADISPVNKKVHKVDLEKRLNFKNNEFDYVHISYVLMYVINLHQLIGEIHRICKPNAIINVIEHHFTSAIGNREDCLRRFNSMSFNEYNFERAQNPAKGHQCPVSKVRFKIIKRDIEWNNGINPLNYIARLFNISDYSKRIYEDTFLRSFFPAARMNIKLQVVK